MNFNILANVINIEYSAFDGCNALTEITVDSQNKMYSAEEGVLFDKNQETIIKFPSGKHDEIYSIPDSVTTIVDRAFESCSNLTTVEIPDGVKTIGDFAFYSCTNLKSIILPDGLEYLGSYAFAGCNNIKKVTIPHGVSSISLHVFESCKNLTSVTILDGAKQIENHAFSGCQSLKDIIIPGTVTSIKSYAFSSCYELTYITIPYSVTSIDYYAFGYCNNLKYLFYQGSEDVLFNSPFSNNIKLELVCVGPGYNSTTFCGNNVSSDNATCTAFQDLFNQCSVPIFDNSTDAFKLQMKSDVARFIGQTGECGEYLCDDETGLIAWSMCNSSKDSVRFCVDNKCVADWGTNIYGWYVEIKFKKNTNFEEMMFSEFVANITSFGSFGIESDKIGVETDSTGHISRAVLYVKDKQIAEAIQNLVNAIPKGETCKYGILCEIESVSIHENAKPIPSSSTSTNVLSGASRETLMTSIFALFVIFEMLI